MKKDPLYPRLLLSDCTGKLFVHPQLLMKGASYRTSRLVRKHELIALPKESTLFYMPGHIAVGYDARNKCDVLISHYKEKKVYPVAAFPIPGYTRLLLPAAQKIDEYLVLPLWAYTAVGWRSGKFYISAVQVDHRSRQRPHYYADGVLLKRNIQRTLKQYAHNRLFAHLAHCASSYNCRAAQNLFFGRWEAPLPVAPTCNARCLGCLSLQDSDCAIASHQRIDFVPSVREIKEVALYHINRVKKAIVSFGQGCEGEPLLYDTRLKEAISAIRKESKRGTIHLNTNAFDAQRLAGLADAGLDSVRISLNSVRDDFYNSYYRPKGYHFADVLDSINVARKKNLFISLNLLVFPGLTDVPSEIEALIDILKKYRVNFLQLKNLCIDSDFYIKNIPPVNEDAQGILAMKKILKKRVPHIRFGYFNVCKEEFNGIA